MDANVRALLHAMYDRFREEHRSDHLTAWDRFITFLGITYRPSLMMQVREDLEWFVSHERFTRSLDTDFDVKTLSTDRYDHLGELYREHVIASATAKRNGLVLTPPDVASLLATMLIPKTNDRVTIYDPCVGTGRLLLAAHERAPNGVFFGVDIDLRALRIAYVNSAIHDMSAYLLHADALYHETDLSTPNGSHNWQYANLWNSHLDKLRPIGREPDLFDQAPDAHE